MTEKEIVLETIRALPDNCSLDEIAERIALMAAVQKGLKQLDSGEGIPHEEVLREIATPNGNVARALAEIAALPLEGDTGAFSGAEHDSVLYPRS